LGFRCGFFPDFGGGGDVEGLDGKQSHEGCFVTSKEHLQDAEEQLGGRRALRK